MPKSSGFGEPKEISTKQAKKLVMAFGVEVHQKDGDAAKPEKFFAKHEVEINAVLLERLPTLFERLINHEPGKRQYFARLLHHFGIALYHVPVGDRQLNLEIFLCCCQLALTVFSKVSDCVTWAGIQNSLGIAYNERIRGDRTDNLELAIAAYERALEIYNRESSPQEWATTQHNLANAYRARIRGDRADNLERAITACERALEVRTREAFPQEWARTQIVLAVAYYARIRGDRADNLERAITACERALEIRTREAFPQDWAAAQNNLASAYYARIRGDRADNLERAVAACERALEVYTREAFPPNWAGTQNNLANIYCDRIRGDRADNLERAITAYEQALEIYTREAFPQDWAMTQGNLSHALLAQHELLETPTNLDQAINLLEAAIQEQETTQAVGTEWHLNNLYTLGNALKQRYGHSKNANDLEAAQAAYGQMLKLISPEHYDIEKYRNTLPSLQSIMGNRLVRDGQWQQGIQLLNESLKQLSQSTDKLTYADALYQTAKAHEFVNDWPNARRYYRDALRLYDHLQNSPGMAQSRHGLGSILTTQGYLEKGIQELQKARELYQNLNKPDQIADLDRLIQAAQKAQIRQHPIENF